MPQTVHLEKRLTALTKKYTAASAALSSLIAQHCHSSSGCSDSRPQTTRTPTADCSQAGLDAPGNGCQGVTSDSGTHLHRCNTFTHPGRSKGGVRSGFEARGRGMHIGIVGEEPNCHRLAAAFCVVWLLARLASCNCHGDTARRASHAKQPLPACKESILLAAAAAVVVLRAFMCADVAASHCQTGMLARCGCGVSTHALQCLGSWRLGTQHCHSHHGSNHHTQQDATCVEVHRDTHRTQL